MAFYYLSDTNQPVGPMDLPAIRKLAKAGVVPHDVLVCEAGSEDWIPLSEKEKSIPQPQGSKPPRTAPPPRSALPPRSYTPPTQTSESRPQATVSTNTEPHPEWFLLASMIAGITAILAMCLPVLSILLAASALAFGILDLRQNAVRKKPFAVTGIATASVALFASLGILMFGSGGGAFGDPGSRYLGSWQVDMSMSIMAIKTDHSVRVTFHKDGRFTEVTGFQMTGADQSSAMRVANGDETTGYWEWDRSRNAIVTRHDGRDTTGYMDGANSEGRSFRTGPFDSGSAEHEEGEEFWVFKPDPNDRSLLIGDHPTMYGNRTMRFYRLN